MHVRERSSAATASTLSSALRSSARQAPCSTTLQRRGRSTTPASAGSNPSSTRSSVVLPDPVGAMRQQRSPGSTARSTWSSTCASPYALETPRRRSGAVGCASAAVRDVDVAVQRFAIRERAPSAKQGLFPESVRSVTTAHSQIQPNTMIAIVHASKPAASSVSFEAYTAAPIEPSGMPSSSPVTPARHESPTAVFAAAWKYGSAAGHVHMRNTCQRVAPARRSTRSKSRLRTAAASCAAT